MAKVNQNKIIQKQRTKEEMCTALADFCSGKQTRSIPPQVDDTDVVLMDVIEELLESRAVIEQVRGFATTILPKIARR